MIQMQLNLDGFLNNMLRARDGDKEVYRFLANQLVNDLIMVREDIRAGRVERAQRFFDQYVLPEGTAAHRIRQERRERQRGTENG